MTEKQMLKLAGMRVKFVLKETPYSVKSKVIEGVVEPIKTVNRIVRDNKLKSYDHYNFLIIQDEGKSPIIEWNQMKCISNLEVLDDEVE